VVTGRLEIQLRHSFDAAHRLPHLAGGNSKCASLHGHTWHATLGITGPVTEDGTVIEFGQIKRTWRSILDTQLDHGCLLGAEDPLLDSIARDGGKLYVFGRDTHTEDLPWPTVEAVATLLSRYAHALTLPGGVYPTSLTVNETPVNSVTWSLI
jgi:6-pyruvoyltetrahydropterin/6-carboxytetrahydropterin synthase